MRGRKAKKDLPPSPATERPPDTNFQGGLINLPYILGFTDEGHISDKS